MKEWLFNFMMKLLLLGAISGIIILLIWKITAILCLLIILLPFALVIYYKIVRTIRSVKT